MLEQAAQTNDRPLRMALYHQADRLLVEQEIVAVPLYYWRAFSLLSSAYEVGEAVRVIRGGKLKLKQLRLAH
jgi:ABC-type oligopeptide transport system substrate-binding subunit